MPATLEGWASTITLIRFSAESTPLAPAWTLFHEVAFYAAFGIFLSNRRAGSVLFLSWILVAALEFHYPPENQRTPYLVYTSAYIFHFIFGATSYYLYGYTRNKGLAPHFLVHTSFLLLTLAAKFDQKFANLQAAIIFSWIIFACTTMEATLKLAKIRWLSELGESSYTLYLLHLPMQGLALKLLMKTPFGSITTYRGWGFIAVFIFTVAASHATYLLIEKPMLRRIGNLKTAKAS